MIQRLKSVVEAPGHILLGWRLLLDPRVPAFSKAVAAGAILLLLSPLDIVDWIPIFGGAGSIALAAMVLRSFINAAPEDVREEHMARLGLR